MTDTVAITTHEDGTTDMRTIDDLARELATTHGIDSIDAAREVVAVHVDQIADDPDLWNADTAMLTAAGVNLVTDAVAHSYSIGAVATMAAQLLVDIEEVAARIAQHKQAVSELTAERDRLIRAALRTELRRADIAAAARVGESRLYQARDGRR